MIYIFLALISVSCKDNKILTENINAINNKIVYYRMTYQSSLYFEDGEFKEKDKSLINTEYFDVNNNLLKEFRTSYGISYNVYEYDNDGNQIGLNSYDETGKLIRRSEFLLSNNRIVSTIGYDNKGKYTGELKIIYDFNGNIIQITFFDENGEYNNSKIYAYNNEKIYSVITFSRYDEFPEVSIYTYNNEGRILEITTYFNGLPLSKYKILEYDDKGRETKNINYVYDFNKNETPSTINYYEYYDN